MWNKTKVWRWLGGNNRHWDRMLDCRCETGLVLDIYIQSDIWSQQQTKTAFLAPQKRVIRNAGGNLNIYYDCRTGGRRLVMMKSRCHSSAPSKINMVWVSVVPVIVLKQQLARQHQILLSHLNIIPFIHQHSCYLNKIFNMLLKICIWRGKYS